MAIDKDKIREGIRLVLEGLGSDPDSGPLAETPGRVADAYAEIFFDNLKITPNN